MPSFKFASATGSGSSLIVTCSDQFAGKTITCTNGTKTYTRTCPSTSPYEVVFKGIAPGTWTVSGVVEGRTYSQQVVITDFDVTLIAGFDYKQWVTLGGLDPTDYTDLDDVFADEVAVRRLMTIHASADYLIEKVTDDIDTIDDFTANDTAMKWIGLRDYVCDGLTAITGVEAKFLASEYWERYLKDHVPVMKSNTVPYGTAKANSTSSGYDAYKAFDNDVSTRFSTSIDVNGWLEYKFTNPICVKRVKIKSHWDGTYSRIKNYKIQASNDGSTYEDLGTFVYPNENVERIIDLTNTTPYLYYRIYVLDKYATNGYYIAITSLQFYGRSLNVSVPVMTSNTAPYGEAIYSTYGSGYEPYKAFDGGITDTNVWVSLTTANSYIGYDFKKPIVLKKVWLVTDAYASGNCAKDVKIEGYDGNEWVTLDSLTLPNDTAPTNHYLDIENEDAYTKYRIFILNQYITQGTFKNGLRELQFYGVDYTEREFAEGSTMKYLYDHGLEIEPMTVYQSGTGQVTKRAEEVYEYAGNPSTGGQGNVASYRNTTKIDLSPYNVVRYKETNFYNQAHLTILASDTMVYNADTWNVAFGGMYSGGVGKANWGGLDISSVNGEYYVYFAVGYGGGSYVSLNEMWLE